MFGGPFSLSFRLCGTPGLVPRRCRAFLLAAFATVLFLSPPALSPAPLIYPRCGLRPFPTPACLRACDLAVNLYLLFRSLMPPIRKPTSRNVEPSSQRHSLPSSPPPCSFLPAPPCRNNFEKASLSFARSRVDFRERISVLMAPVAHLSFLASVLLLYVPSLLSYANSVPCPHTLQRVARTEPQPVAPSSPF